jgi:hypothetical protein
LLPVRERVSGPEHPDTLLARANLDAGPRRRSEAPGRRELPCRMFALRNGQRPHQGSSSACTCVRHTHEAMGVAPGACGCARESTVAVARHEHRRRGVRCRCTG